MVPFSHLNPWHEWPVRGTPRKKDGQEKRSPSGLTSPVSEKPTMMPCSFLTGQAIALLLLGPPRAPRSIFDSLTQSAACATWSPFTVLTPVTQPRLLILLPPAFAP